MRFLKNLAAVAGFITLATAVTVETFDGPECSGPSETVEVNVPVQCIRTPYGKFSVQLNRNAGPPCQLLLHQDLNCLGALVAPPVVQEGCTDTVEPFASVRVVCEE